jgi:serine/threonine protein kinase
MPVQPENVMLKTDASAAIGAVAKITDFGLSTTLGPHATHVSNYKSGE